MECLFVFNCKNCIQKWILQVIFSRRCSICPKNKSVHNFLIINANGMNQRFTCKKNIIYEEKRFRIFFSNIPMFFVDPSPLFWTHLGITFVPRLWLKKNDSQEANLFFYLQKKFQKIMTKIQSVDTSRDTTRNPICPPNRQWSFRD